MNRISLRACCLAAPAALALLASCNSQPTATTPNNTAVVVPKEANSAADSMTAKKDSMTMKKDSTAR